MRIDHADSPIGTSISEINLSHCIDANGCLDEQTLAAIRTAFYSRAVLCLRGQSLSPDQLLAVARGFGEPDEHFLGHYRHPEHANILLVSNIQADGKNVGFADAGRVWHSDGSYMQTPVAISMLYAIEVPVGDDGQSLGSTRFCSAAHAYDALDSAMKQRIEPLQVLHQVAGRREAIGTGLKKDRAHEQAQPDALHPAVRVHSYTARRYLFVNKGECTGISGMKEGDALHLIEELSDCIAQPQNQYVHQWKVGDLLIWDNQAVQHLATFDYAWPEHRRMMHRITITEGTEPHSKARQIDNAV
ncbi:MAG: TauD/TfdA family dioxygenase [Chromatiales bacterium]|jgi:taurine dioxygenase|nr:TauD/TfdA family dioxygenase [Chromatiales bacterium]